MKNFLYITDNNELIETKAKEFAGANNLYFFYFILTKESLD